MIMDETVLAYMSISDQAKLIQSKEISPVDLVQIYLKRIKTWDGALSSWITVCGERALDQAKVAEAEITKGNYRGPLHGIPYGVKDQMSTEGIPTTLASILEKDFGNGSNATVIDKLEESGAILLGKQNLHAFGKGSSLEFHFGEPKNPWNLKYETSHSSSGSGTAVAAGFCSGALAEDTGGSIRGPAWATGIVGTRPTYGRVSRHGGIMFAWTLDTIGPMTRTVKDNALLLQATAGYDVKDPLSSTRPVPDYTKSFTKDLKGIRLGLIRELSFDQKLHPEVEKSLNDALESFKSLGAIIEEISLPRIKYAVPLNLLTSEVDVSSMFIRKWLRDRWDEFDRGTRTRSAAAALVPGSIYSRAMRGRAVVRNEVLEACKKYDGLIALMNFVPPAPFDDALETIETGKDVMTRLMKSRRICTFPFSLANVPAMSVPTGFTEGGLPMSIQIVAKPFDEEMMYRIGHAYEQATPWHTMHPDLEKTVRLA